MPRCLRLIAAAVLALFALGLTTSPALAFPDTYAGRLEALTLVQRLNADLLSRPSATETLTRWCADRRLADPAEIKALRLPGVFKPASRDVRMLLGAGPHDQVRYRRVQLMCGLHVLSEADNWYLPSRLTPQMNQALDYSETPFGVVVRPLGFQRQTLEATILYHPFPGDSRGVAAGAGGRLVLPLDVLQHVAVLTTAAGSPFSVVVETYSRDLLETAELPQR